MSGTTNTTNITFTRIPSNLLIHGTFAELDPQTPGGTQAYRSLIINNMLASGVAAPTIPIPCGGGNDAITQAGRGSRLAIDVASYLAGDDFGELWLLPLADDPAAAAATLAITVTNGPTLGGVIPLYVDGVLVPVDATAGDTPTETAANIAAAIEADLDLPVTASSAAAVLTVTAKNKGLIGNDLDLRLAYNGTQGGEVVPPGLTFTNLKVGTGTQLTGGAQNPTAFATALANLGDMTFDFVMVPYTDAVSLNAWQAFMDENSGRWAWDHMLYGGGFAAQRATYGAATAFALTRNDGAIDITPIYDMPQSPTVWASRMMADCAVSLRANPAVPLQNLVHDTLMPPPVPARFDASERNSLLGDGLSTFTVNDAGQVVSDRHVTTYKTAPDGESDTSYQDVETRYTLAYALRDLKSYTEGLYSRKIFVDDDTRITSNTNNAICTPSMIKASVATRYYYLEGLGLVQDADTFLAGLAVQKVGSMARVYRPGDVANQLRQIGFAIAFTKT